MNRRERKKEETRANIITSAVTLFRNKGFEATSMEEIAETADVSKGTLYNYFQDKESILVAYFQSYIIKHGTEFNVRIQNVNGIEAKLNYLLDFATQILEENKDIAAIYLRFRMQSFHESNPFDNPKRSGLENLVLAIMQEAQANNEIRIDIPTLTLAKSFQFLIRSYLLFILYTNNSPNISPTNLQTSKNQLIDLFLNGAKP